MQSLKDRYRGKSELEMEAEGVGRGVERLGLISIRDFESKTADNGGRNMRLFVLRSLKIKIPRNRRAGDRGGKE